MKIKNILIPFALIISASVYSQNQTATTESGKKVILKPNNTWEYVQGNNQEPECNLEKDEVKKANERLRKHAAVENDCTVADVKFINMTEGMGNGMYSLCIKGKIMKYKKVGTVFMKADANPMGN
jgi:hypothetical protein